MLFFEKMKNHNFVTLLKNHLTPHASSGIISLAPNSKLKERTRRESVRIELEQLKSGKEINSTDLTCQCSDKLVYSVF